MSEAASGHVAVVIGSDAPELEIVAAHELSGYLEGCFGVRTVPSCGFSDQADTIFLIGSPSTNSHVARACSRRPFPQLGEQGFVLRTLRYQKRPAILIGGGSARATMWGVGELAERWGVRHLLHGDVFPSQRELWLPQLSYSREPVFPIRQWRAMNSHAIGPETWGLADYRSVLRQLARLKFNRIFIHIWPNQPFLHYCVDDIERNSATIFFGFRYPIDEGTVGKQVFGDCENFSNPDLPVTDSYEELAAAGRRLIEGIIDFATRLGMECGMNANLFEYPGEFAPALTSSVPSGHHLTRTVFPSDATDVDDPRLRRIATTVLETIVDTYPGITFLTLEMPEFRRWVKQYRRAWKALDRKYGIEGQRPLESVLEAASRRSEYPGGAERAVQEVKGDIVNLYFFDRLLNEDGGLAHAANSGLKIVWDSVAEELFPILPSISGPGWETLNFIDYAPSSIVKRLRVMSDLATEQLPATLTYTLHDDNVGFMPQLTLDSLHKISTQIRHFGWAGYSARYWQIGDHDPSIAYMAKVAWDPSTDPERICRDLAETICGPESVDDFLDVWREVQEATVTLEQHALGLAFPTPQMLMKHWIPEAFPEPVERVRSAYTRALAAAERALSKSAPRGREHARYWIGRLEFGIAYLDALENVRKAARMEAAGRIAESIRWGESAGECLRRAGEAHASVARDQSDRGAIAVLNRHGFRPLFAKIEQLRRLF